VTSDHTDLSPDTYKYNVTNTYQGRGFHWSVLFDWPHFPPPINLEVMVNLNKVKSEDRHPYRSVIYYGYKRYLIKISNKEDVLLS